MSILVVYMTKKANWVIIGRHAVLESLTSGQAIDKVMTDRMISLPDIMEAAKKAGVPVQKVPMEKLNKFGANHQGVAAFKAMVEYQKLDELVPHLYEQGKTPLIVILDRITDVGNFGAITRSSEVLGADVIVFPARESAQLNADAVKRSSGALLRIPLSREKDLASAIRYLQQSGIMVLAADEKAKTSIHDIDFKKPVAIVLGSEGEGVAPDLLRKVDDIIYIPQTGKMDSLNVSVAAGIILYEIQRQRKS